MGKDTKELLRTILANTQLILKHLNLDVEKNEMKKDNPSEQKVRVKSPAKKAPSAKKPVKRK